MLAALLGLSACSSATITSDQLNFRLPYLDWQEKAAVDHTPPPCTDKQKNVVAIQPGMGIKLLFTTGRKKQAATPIIATYTWVFPSIDRDGKPADSSVLAHYGAADYFFLAYLGAAGTCEIGTCDATNRAMDLGLAVPKNSPNFRTALNRSLVQPTLKTLTLYVERNAKFISQPCTADWLREWLGEPASQDDFLLQTTDPNPRQWLRLEYPALGAAHAKFKWKALDWDSSAYFFERSVSPAVQNVAGHQWYAPDVDPRRVRAHAVPVLPVRAESQVRSELVPIYWTVADLEHAWGREIVGLYRQAAFIAPQTSDDVLLWFDWLKPNSALALEGGAAAKKATLLAPGDVVVLSEQRLRRTDAAATN
ncbi:MAG TPA: hypothetical protein VG734_01695 [Lacunisphaera sp.]|nr:hypothetical protein [Lacunisphaera sp.]